jgi:surface antigen
VNTIFYRILLVLAMAGAAPAAWPVGWGAILRNGPVEDFNDEDMRLFLAAIKQAVEAPESSQPVEWRNADSGAGGTLQVLGRSKVQDFDDCRRVRTTLHSRRQRGVPSVWTTCKDASGRWRLVSVG